MKYLIFLMAILYSYLLWGQLGWEKVGEVVEQCEVPVEIMAREGERNILAVANGIETELSPTGDYSFDPLPPDSRVYQTISGQEGGHWYELRQSSDDRDNILEIDAQGIRTVCRVRFDLDYKIGGT